MIRIFTHSLPPRLRTESLVRISSRLAHSLYTFGINANYTQHSLKCNLSVSAWTQVIKTLANFEKPIIASPSRSLAVLVALSEVLLLNQMHPLYCRLSEEVPTAEEDKTVSNIHSKSRSGFSESFATFAQAVKKRRSTRFNRSGILVEEPEDNLEEKESGSGTEELSESAEHSSFESSEESSSSGESVLDTLVLIDNSLDPGRVENVRGEDKAKKQSLGRSSFRQGFRPQEEPEEDNQIEEEASQNSISDIEEDTEQNLKSNRNINFGRKSIISGLNLHNFDIKAPIDRLKPKIERRRVLNDVRLKKVNFSEKLKITKVTNTFSIEQVMTMVAKETPLEWNNFDVYAGNNKYNIKDVVAQYVDNFTNNLVLGVTNDRGLTQLQQTFNTKYLIRNMRAGKVKSLSSSSAIHQPEFGIVSTSKAKVKTRKLIAKYYELLNQVVNAHYCQVQLTESKGQQQQSASRIAPVEIETSRYKSESYSPDMRDPATMKRRVVRTSMVKFMFLGEQLDQTSLDYIQQNLSEYLDTYLHSSSSLLWKKSLEIGVLFDLTKTVVLTDSYIRTWLVCLLINLILIGRQFQIVKIHTGYTLKNLLGLVQTSLEDALLYGRKVTIIFDIEELSEIWLSEQGRSTSEDDSLDILFNTITQFLNGTAHYAYHSTFLHHLISHMWQEDYVKTLTYDELLDQISKALTANVNFVVFASKDSTQPIASYLQRKHPSLFDSTVVRLFGSVIEESYFDRTILWRLLKHMGTSHAEKILENGQNLQSKMFERDMQIIEETVMKGYFNFENMLQSAKNTVIMANTDKIHAIIDVGICFKHFNDNNKLSQFEYATDCLQRILSHAPDHKNLENAASLVAANLAMAFQNVNIPKVLRSEDLFIGLMGEGLSMNSLQINILSTIHLILSYDFSVFPVVYDPQGYSVSFFKSLTKATKPEHSFQFTDSVECRLNPSLLAAKIEAGTRVVLGINNLVKDDLDLAESLVQALIRYFSGQALGYYTGKNKFPTTRILQQKVDFHNSFKFAVIIRKRGDLLKLLRRFKECKLLEHARLLAFEEHITSSMINPKAAIRELETSKKQRHLILNLSQTFSSDRTQLLFSNINDMSSAFNINDRVLNRQFTFLNPDDTKASVDYPEILRSMARLNLEEVSKVQTIPVHGIGKISVLMKMYISPEDPFDSTCTEQYYSPAIKDLSSTFQKVLCYFSHTRAGQEGGVDAYFLMVTLASLFDNFKSELVAQNQGKFRNESEAACLEVEQKFRQSFGSERVVKFIEHVCPDFWYQLELAFVIKMSFSLLPADVPLFKLWLWMNHTNYDKTGYSKFAYSNTFQKRLNTMNTSLSMSKYICSEPELELRDFKVLLKLQSYKEPQELLNSPVSHRSLLSPASGTIHQNLRALFGSLGVRYLEKTAVDSNPFALDTEHGELAAIEDVESYQEMPSLQKMKRKHSDFVVEETLNINEKLPSSASSKLSRRQSSVTPSPSAYRKSKFAQASKQDSRPESVTPKGQFLDPVADLNKDPSNDHRSITTNKEDTVSVIENAQLQRSDQIPSKSRFVSMAKLVQIAEGSEISSSMKNISVSHQNRAARKNTDYDEENSPGRSYRGGVNLLILKPLDNEEKGSEDEDPDQLIQRDLERNKQRGKSGAETPKRSEEGNSPEKVPYSPGEISRADSIISPLRKEKWRKRGTEMNMRRKISFRFDTFKDKDSLSPGSSPFKSPARSGKGAIQESKLS